IAEYPFTTLSPNLGVAGDERVVVADVPGLIQGASVGKGLGLAFLRHVARCRVLVYVVDLAVADPAGDLATVRAEVAAYDPALAERRSLSVGTKLDLLTHSSSTAVDLAVSGLTGENIPALSARLDADVAAARASQPPPTPFVVLRPGRDPFV